MLEPTNPAPPVTTILLPERFSIWPLTSPICPCKNRRVRRRRPLLSGAAARCWSRRIPRPPLLQSSCPKGSRSGPSLLRSARVKIVEYDDDGLFFQEPPHDVGADESRAPRYYNPLARKVLDLAHHFSDLPV